MRRIVHPDRLFLDDLGGPDVETPATQRSVDLERPPQRADRDDWW